MTEAETSSPTPHAVALRASAIGALLTAAVVAAVTGIVSGEVLAAATRPFVGGAVAGALAGTLGNLLVARGALARVGGPEASAEFLRAIVLDFGLQVFAVVAGTVGMFLLGVKFQEFAAFGTTLAGAAVLFRLPGTVSVSRALTERAARQRASKLALSQPEEAASSHEPELPTASAAESHS